MFFHKEKLQKIIPVLQGEMIEEVINQVLIRLTHDIYHAYNHALGDGYMERSILVKMSDDICGNSGRTVYELVRKNRRFEKFYCDDGIKVYNTKTSKNNNLFVLLIDRKILAKKYYGFLEGVEGKSQIFALTKTGAEFLKDYTSALSFATMWFLPEQEKEKKENYFMAQLGEIARAVYFQYHRYQQPASAAVEKRCPLTQVDMLDFVSAELALLRKEGFLNETDKQTLYFPLRNYPMEDALMYVNKVTLQEQAAYAIDCNWKVFFELLPQQGNGRFIAMIANQLELLLHEVAHVYQFEGCELPGQGNKVPVKRHKITEEERQMTEEKEREAEQWAGQISNELTASQELFEEFLRPFTDIVVKNEEYLRLLTEL